MKIINIGLPRTGTENFHKFMQKTGRNCIHNFIRVMPSPFDIATATNTINKYDVVSDVPVYAMFREIYERFPNAKYVITTREINSWIKSMKNYFSVLKELRKNGMRGQYDYWLDKHHEEILYTVKFDEEALRLAFKQHHFSTSSIFGGNLLVLMLEDKNNHQKVREFLGEHIYHSYPTDTYWLIA